MARQLTAMWILALFASCSSPDKDNTGSTQKIQADSSVTTLNEQRINSSDTTFSIFNDPDYSLSFKVFQPAGKNEEAHLGTLTLTHRLNNQTELLLNDTLEFFRPVIRLKDFNNDKVKDLMILYTSGARSNWTHHLYLVDNNNHTLKRVKDFENISNPELDTVNNIITSIALSGTNYYTFYRIDKKGNVIDLENSFEDDGTSKSNKYDKAIKNILRQKK